MTEKYKHIAVDPKAHKKAKVDAYRNDKTLKEYVEDLINKNGSME